MTSSLMIMDVGAHSIKAGYVGDSSALNASSVRVFPNYVGKRKAERESFVADEIEGIDDPSGLLLHSPFEKGFLVNWDLQREIWDRVFNFFECEPTEADLILTEPIFNFSLLQQQYDEVIFEEYGFHSAFRTTGPELCARQSWLSTGNDCLLVIDSGHSFTNIIPFLHDRPQQTGIRRIDLGGKILTNYLKGLVSFRHWNMMEETYLVNQIKEQCCFVARDFNEEMRNHKKLVKAIEYVLPDFSNARKGYIRESDSEILETDQILPLNNERFTVPESLFHPSDIGLDQAGIAEAVTDSVGSQPAEMQGPLFANILMIGGNACFSGLPHRLYSDLRPLVSTDYILQIHTPANPTQHVWHSAAAWASSNWENFQSVAKTRIDYYENGPLRWGTGQQDFSQSIA